MDTITVGTVRTEYSFSVLLEYAADNNVEGFKQYVSDESEVCEVGLWYCHHRLSRKGILQQRTPLMVAAKYGSLEVMKLILALPEVDVNFSCGLDKSNALHCAASGGSSNALEAVRLLLLSGADPNTFDSNGNRPVDVIVPHPKFPSFRIALERLLKGNISSGLIPKREYIIDPPFPDGFANEEFWMFLFKIQPCSRAYSHDWTECPFAHPGENARRRDPRKFHYSCVPCPDHRKGVCRNGDFCEFSHGIFESWLHPAQYRTRLCKDGTNCKRRVCFFAHTNEQLRPSLQFPFTLMAWPQQNISNLKISGDKLQTSRLRTSSFGARNVPSQKLNNSFEDFEVLQQHFLNDLSWGSQPHHYNSSANLSSFSKQLNPANPYRLFSSEVPSPRNTHYFQQSSSSCQLNSREVNSWSNQDPTGGNVDWSFEADEVSQLQKCSTGQFGEEPDVSWIQSVLKESPSETEDSNTVSVSGPEEGSKPHPPSETIGHMALRAFIDSLQIDQIITS